MYICRIRWTKTDKERRLFPNIPRTYSTRYPGKLIATEASYPAVWILNGFWAVVQLPRPLWPVKYTRGYETVYLSSKISDAIMHGSRGVTLRFLRHRQTQRDANEMRPTDRPNNVGQSRMYYSARILLPINHSPGDERWTTH